MADKWNKRTDAPEIGTTIIAKMVDGYDKAYQIFEIKNGATQTQVMNNANIDGWLDVQTIITTNNVSGAKLLSGIKEGVDNDWAPTVNGYVQQEYDIYMLRQQINARIQTLPTEVDDFDGVDYMNIIFGKTSIEQKAAVFVEVIQNIPAVKSVNFINASWIDKVKGEFQFIFEIQSVFGDLEFKIGVDEQQRLVFARNDA